MTAFISALGGIGFFLLGMGLMTDGLKAIAGDSLRKLLNRFTGGTMSSIATGTIITLLVQSSTATSLMTIGFVSAGMLTFVQAAGVIFGANLGTTSTGWIVSFIGLKFSISQLALPLIGIGVLLKQFSRGRWAHFGLFLAGLGLIFVGIQFLQDGMSGLSDRIDLSGFEGTSVFSRLILIIIGIIMTIIMQSSSAAVATTITVLATGAIDLEQAIAIVIGQHIGTTATAAVAAIGASAPAKRTALAHILFNVITAAIVFFIFPYYVQGTIWFASLLSWEDPSVILALFNTSFPLLGIAILAPFIHPFTRMIKWLLPDKKSAITQHLDSSVISLPAVATETAMRALKEAAVQSLTETSGKFNSLAAGMPIQHPQVVKMDEKLQHIRQEMKEIKRFVEAIRTDSQESAARYTSLLHALDHAQRMIRLAMNNLNEVKLASSLERIDPIVSQWKALMAEAIEALREERAAEVVPKLSAFSQELAQFRKKERAEVFEVTAKGEVNAEEAFQYVQLILFIDGISYHIWRMLHHLSEQESDD